MATTSSIKVIPNLVQGVTQQAPQQARDSQCAVQLDCFNDASSGCGARPPAEVVKVWAGRNLEGAFFSETEHIGENYLTGVDAAGNPFAVDLADGTDCTVTVSASLSYLTSGATLMRDKLRAQVAEDTTFLVNRDVAVGMSGTTSPAKVNEALVFVRTSGLVIKYTIALSGPGAASATLLTNNEPASTQDIAEAFRVGAVQTNITSYTGDALHGTDGYTCARFGSLLRITRGDGQPFTIAVSDGLGDDAMLAFNGEASTLDRLPKTGFGGMILKVGGEDRTQDDDYYLRFTGPSSTGRWIETLAPGTQTNLAASSMPHTLVNTGYRAFEFKRPSWSSRIAGDALVTAKDPAFVGRRLRDVFYHQRRLALLHDSGAVFSKADAPFTFFPDTVQTLLDTAPVDVKSSNSSGRGATSLDFAVQVSEKLYLWGQRQQHVVTHGDEAGFSQKTVSIAEATSYEYSDEVDPVPLGSFLCFSTDVGPWSSLRALQFQQNRVLGDIDLSAHVPSYINERLHTLATSETLRAMFMVSRSLPSSIFVFNYLWDGEKFAQQAFNRWRLFGGQVLWMGVRGNYLRILQQRPEGVLLLRINLTPRAVDPKPGATYTTRLDYRLDETGVTGLSYNATTQQSSFTLPFVPNATPTFVVVSEDMPGGYSRGKVFETVSVVGSVVTVKGDLTGYKFYVGQRIEAVREELEFFIRGDQGSEPVDELTINKWSYTFSNTGYSRLEVISSNGQLREYAYEGRLLGGSSGQTGSPPIGAGSVEGEVGHASKDVRIRIVNDSFLPSYWQNAAVEFTAVGWKGHK